jgi:hypothetical protein
MTFECRLPILWPEHIESWARDCVDRVAALLEDQQTGPGRVGLEWCLGAYSEEPDWIGPGRPRRRGSRVDFMVGIPRAIQDTDLESTLLDFAAGAVEVAEERLVAAKLAFDAAGHARAIELCRAEIARLEPVRERRARFLEWEERFARRRYV